MLNRRLVVLFVLVFLGLCVLATRLRTLQFTQADAMRKELQISLMQRSPIETARGAILDRNNIKIAYDKPSYHLVMDYRAMNLDDGWLARAASDRLEASGEKFATRAQRSQRIAELKETIKREIDAIPAAIAQRCDTSDLDDPSPDAPPLEKVLARFHAIREDINTLRVNVWDFALRRDRARDEDFNRMLEAEKLTHIIIPHITDDLAFYFIAHAQEYPGLIVRDSRLRVYPYKDVACQVIGSLRRVNAAERDRLPFRFPNLRSEGDEGQLNGYRDIDLIGDTGVEAKKEDTLHGQRGCWIIERGGNVSDDAAPAVDEDTASSPDRRIDPKFGQDVRLTLDIALQQDIEAALHDPAKRLLRGKDDKDHFVAVVVLSMDGQVLSLISTPGYDLNDMDNIRNDLNQDEYRRPQANRALQGYQPGSTIKPLIATAALTEHLVTPQETITCNGYLFPNRPTQYRCSIYLESHATHGPLQLADAIAQSCNIYFYTLGGRLGTERLVSWLSAFGLGRDSGLELHDQDGLLPQPRQNPDEDQYNAILMGIGQGPVFATPLQMASAYATLLRGGQWIQPHIFADTVPQTSQMFHIAPEHLAAIREGMRRTVTVGTAKKVMTLHIPVAGKTGTADVKRKAFDDEGHPVFDPLKNADGTPKLGPDGQPQFARAFTAGTDAWFVGYVPADKPKFVIAAVMEFGGHGGAFSAPIVKETILQLEKHRYLPQMDVP
ncbi:MAG: penicillin-binding transpeptidase domain-containing protein [Phycisphaerales bacterium]|nr:penicillin-binding transpeptidase domain-containing protein [Phycisphaerales bacterium]